MTCTALQPITVQDRQHDLFVAALTFYAANPHIPMKATVFFCLKSLYWHATHAEVSITSQFGSLLVAVEILSLSPACESEAMRQALKRAKALVNDTSVKYGGRSLW